MVPPDNEMLELVVASVPPQVAVLAFGAVSPEGKVSVKPTPVRVVTVSVLVIVKVSDEVPLSAMFAGLNDVAMVGVAARAGAKQPETMTASVAVKRRTASFHPAARD